MAAPENECAFDLDVALAAADRYAARTAQHKKFDEAVRNKQYTALDTPERCADRANRLLDKLQGAAPGAAEAMTVEFGEALGGGERVTPDSVDDALLERVIGRTRDFEFVEFLEQALYASRSVGRVVQKLAGGRSCFGTGFLVSPRLLITNHHVLPNSESAARSTVEFDYQRDRLGHDVRERAFRLDPAVFYLSDKELDFAVVAVDPAGVGSGRPLAHFKWCPLLADAGKIVAPEPINIVQHPKGERKQVVVRENRLIDALDGVDRFYHYEADTEPGSSGSPVFNDQWEVVALHHSGVPKRNNRKEPLKRDGTVWRKGVDDPALIDWVANEGVRVSKIVAHLSAAAAAVTGAAARLLRELLDATAPPPDLDGPTPPEPRPEPRPEPTPGPDEETAMPAPSPAGTVTLTIPLHITVSLGAPGSVPAVAVTQAAAPPPDESQLEKIEIDPDYTTRPGYRADFLGFDVPFPRLSKAAQKQAFELPGVTGDARFVLKYHHYSVLLNRGRRLAFAAGVNFDPVAKVRHKRDPKDAWSFDPRVPKEFQAGEELYAGNPLDRGHLVRRADAGWGKTAAEAKLANDDTFHFTNCSPQHAITNQGKTKIKDGGKTVTAPPGLLLWGKLEEHVAAQGKAGKRKLCVFNGPVFRPTDKPYRDTGVRLPEEFWKLVVFADDAGEPAAAAFVLSQKELIKDLEEFDVGEYVAVQVAVKDLEARTKLDFGPVAGWDVLDRDEVVESLADGASVVVLDSLDQVVGV